MSVFLNDLDDFIIPSQACINPFVLARKDGDDSISLTTITTTTTASSISGANDGKDGGGNAASQPSSNSSSSSSSSNPVKYLKLSLEDDSVGNNPSSRSVQINNFPPGTKRTNFPLTKTNLMVESNSKVDGSDKKVAKVSLSDCLACSGCVTTAETLLIEDQSYLKLLKVIEDNNKGSDSEKSSNLRVVISFSLQSLASISAVANIPINELFSRLVVLLKATLGVTYVIDMANIQELCLLETCHEFMHRLKNKNKLSNSSSSGSSGSNSGSSNSGSSGSVSGKSGVFSSITPSIAVSSTSLRYVTSSADVNGGNSSNSNSNSNRGGGGAGSLTNSVATEVLDIGYPSLADQNLPTPFFVSHCPGWICYVEKSLNSSASVSNSITSKANANTVPYNPLSYVSTTKSAQQILGSIFKKVFPAHESQLLSSTSTSDSSSASNSRPYYLVSIQPCFDKKLEASRKDFYHEDTKQSDIDLVISTTEFWNLLEHIMPSIIPSANSEGNLSGGGCGKMDKSIDKVSDFIRSFSLEDASTGLNPVEKMFRSSGNSLFKPDANGAAPSLDQMTAVSSGSFLEFVYRYISANYCRPTANSDPNVSAVTWSRPLTYTGGRNLDISEILLPISQTVGSSNDGGSSDGVVTGQSQLKFVRAYGFRNIQSLLMKLKKAKVDFDFVEIMACPSGCVNGGGQLKLSNVSSNSSSSGSGGGDSIRESPQEVKARVGSVTGALLDHVSNQPPSSSSSSSSSAPDSNPFINNSLIQFIFSESVTGGPMTDRAVSLLHTRYHVVPRLDLIAPESAKW